MLHRQFGFECAVLGLIDGESVRIRAAIHRGPDGPVRVDVGDRIALGEGPVGHVAVDGRARFAGEGLMPTTHIEGLGLACSELCVPLAVGDRQTGVICVRSERADAFAEQDLHLLQVIAALIAPALETAQAYELERRRVRQIRLVNEISRLISSSLHREEVATLACDTIIDSLNVTFAGVYLCEDSGGLTRVGQGARRPLHGDQTRLSAEQLLGPILRDRVFEQGHTERLSQLSLDSDYRRRAEETRSAVLVPLRLAGEVIGVLLVEDTDPARFTVEDERLLENLAGFIGQAIDNARLFESQRRRWQQLLLINEVARMSTSSLELSKILEMTVTHARDRFDYHAVSLMLVEGSKVVVRAIACAESAQIGIGYEEPIGFGIAGTTVRNGRTLLLTDPEQFGGSTPATPGVTSILSVPLVASSRCIGVLQVQREDPRVLNVHDRVVMETLAESVAGAIANARSLEENERLRRELNQMLVHDLRNPLQSVLVAFGEIERHVGLPTTTQDAVGSGLRCAEEMLHMINSLLDVSRFEAGKMQIRPMPAALNDHLRAVVHRLAPLARNRDTKIELELCSDLPVLRLDHELISRMVTNLIGNAIKFTAGGTIVVSTRLIDPEDALADGRSRAFAAAYVELTVRDDGEGIPEAEHRRIFDAFGQVDSRRSGLRMSSGLGLSLCKYVVEGHRGKIWVESTPGEGATFFVALPVGEDAR